MYEDWNWDSLRNQTEETTTPESAEGAAETSHEAADRQIPHISEVARAAQSEPTQPAYGAMHEPEQAAQSEPAQPAYGAMHEPEQAAQSEPTQPEQTAQSETIQPESAQQPGVTYSWVNPRLQEQRSAQSSTSYGAQSGSSYGAQSGGAQQSWSERTKTVLQQPSARPTRAAKKQKKTTGRRWATTIAMALVFGLIAGGAMFAVNRAGNAFVGGNEKVTATTADSYKRVETSATTIPEAANIDETTSETSVVGAGTVAEVTQNAMPSLVTISTMSVAEMQSFFGGTQEYEVEGAGTGVIVGQNDTELLIATNNHVIQGATEVSVGFIDETASPARIKGTDAEVDLAVIAVKLSDIPEETMNAIRVITLGNSDDLVLGEQVVAIGNALGYGQSVTSGYISAFDRELELTDGYEYFTSSGLIQTDAAINSGNSGGALLNMRGELVGINEAKASMSSSGATVDNVGYSIPISKAEPILQDLMNLETKEAVAEEERGYLGIRCADVNSETSERYNIPTGVYVREVSPESPAAKAGILQGDVITKLDGQKVTSYDALTSAMEYCRAGEEVEVIVQRVEGGSYQEKKINVTLGEVSAIENFESEQETMPNEMQQFGN